MRQLHPASVGQVDPAEVYVRLPRLGADRPSVRLNMIPSADEAAALAGRSGTLGGQGDETPFATLRSLADGVLVGVATLRTERYGPPAWIHRLDGAGRLGVCRRCPPSRS